MAKKGNKNSLKEHEMLWAAAQGELERFWKRTNLLLVLQTGVIAISSRSFADGLKGGDSVAILAAPMIMTLAVLVTLAVVGWHVCYRGIEVYEFLTKAIAKKEKICGISVIRDCGLVKTPVVCYYILYLNEIFLFLWMLGLWAVFALRYFTAV